MEGDPLACLAKDDLMKGLLSSAACCAGSFLRGAQELFGKHSFEHFFEAADIDAVGLKLKVRGFQSRIVRRFVAGYLFRNCRGAG